MPVGARPNDVEAHLLQLEDESVFARQVAIKELSRLDPPVLLAVDGARNGSLTHTDRCGPDAAPNGAAGCGLAEEGSAVCSRYGAGSVANALVWAMVDSDWYVRREATNLLGKLGGGTLAAHVDAVALLVEDEEVDVRRVAIATLGCAGPEALAKHANSIAKQLSHENCSLRIAAIQALGQLEPAALIRQMAAIGLRMQDPEVRVHDAAAAVLGRLLHAAAAQGWIDVADFIVTHHRAALLHCRDAENNTPLHIAAREGQLEICQLLVRSGALLKAKNNKRLTAVDLAQQCGNPAIFDLMESRKNLTTVRGGTGDALAPALADVRPVIKVEWYTIPLPGVAGSVGGVHSLLAVTVGNTMEPSHTYVIEKAAAVRSGSENDPEKCRNGVYVSHWLDVVPNIADDPIHSLPVSDIFRDGCASHLRMRTLRQVAVGLGPYDVCTCNCHHAALEVYNHCAQEHAKVPFIPNHILTATAGLLRLMGVDVANSQSGSGSLTSGSGSTRALEGLSEATFCDEDASAGSVSPTSRHQTQDRASFQLPVSSLLPASALFARATVRAEEGLLEADADTTTDGSASGDVDGICLTLAGASHGEKDHADDEIRL